MTRGLKRTLDIPPPACPPSGSMLETKRYGQLVFHPAPPEQTPLPHAPSYKCCVHPLLQDEEGVEFLLSHKVNVRLTLQTPPLATCSSHKTLLEQLQKTLYLTTVTTTPSGKSGRRPKKRLPTCCATGWFCVILSSLVVLFVVCLPVCTCVACVDCLCKKSCSQTFHHFPS